MADVNQMMPSPPELSEIDIIGKKPTGWKPHYIRDIHGEKIWPRHFENLLESSVKEDVTIHYIGAALAYTLFVEAGFVPCVQSKDERDLEPDEIIAMQFQDYMLQFGSNYPARRFIQDFLAVKFKVVIDYDEVSRPAIDKEKYSDDEDSLPSDITVKHSGPTNSLVLNEKTGLKQNETGSRYRYSHDIKMMMKICENGVEINIISKNLEQVQKYYRLNVLQFCETFNDHSVKKSASEWLQLIKLNGSKLSSTFKQEFVMKILDSLGGVSHELRGLQSLPPEVLLLILKMGDVKTVCVVAQTSTYLRSVTQNNGLWEILVKRAFPVQTESQRTLLRAGSSNEETQKHRYKRLLTDERNKVRLEQERDYSMLLAAENVFQNVWYTMPFDIIYNNS